MTDECAQVLAELEVLLDDECADDLRTQLERHLHGCGQCISRADFETKLRELVAQKCRDRAPAGLLDRVLAALQLPTGGA